MSVLLQALKAILQGGPFQWGWITPSTVNSVVTANGTFSIVRVNTLAPAGVPVLHDIIGRR